MLDADGDGLNGFSELSLQTNLFSSNTDGDNLTDGEEVNTYHTNPLATDSDNDGIDDSSKSELNDDNGLDDNAGTNHDSGSTGDIVPETGLDDNNDENDPNLTNDEENSGALDDFDDEGNSD